MVAAAIRTAFTQETPAAARKEWRAVADRLRGRFPKLGELMDEAEDDVLAHMLPCLASASSSAAMQNDASIVIDTRHDSTRRENQSSTTAR
jgi:Transposase, Mutator family